VLVVVPVVGRVPVPFMQIVQMVVVRNGTVTAPLPVNMVMLARVVRPMLQLVGHERSPLPGEDAQLTVAVGGTTALRGRRPRHTDSTGDNDTYCFSWLTVLCASEPVLAAI
jgi:hypothetical protein